MPEGRCLVPGWFSWSRTIEYGGKVGATPNGRRAGEPISHGANPNPGFRRDGAGTAQSEGIAKVQQYISSLASDDKSQALVDMVMRLLAKDAKGTLKASRIIQLRKMAEKSGAPEFIEGVKIIEEAYQPIKSRTFLKAYVKDEQTGAWDQIPLGMTEA